MINMSKIDELNFSQESELGYLITLFKLSCDLLEKSEEIGEATSKMTAKKHHNNKWMLLEIHGTLNKDGYKLQDHITSQLDFNDEDHLKLLEQMIEVRPEVITNCFNLFNFNNKKHFELTISALSKDKHLLNDGEWIRFKKYHKNESDKILSALN